MRCRTFPERLVRNEHSSSSVREAASAYTYPHEFIMAHVDASTGAVVVQRGAETPMHHVTRLRSAPCLPVPEGSAAAYTHTAP